MNKLTLFCLLAAFFLGSALATTCISNPGPLGGGAGCGAGLPCNQFHYCTDEGVCARRVKEGDDCKDADCESGLICKGPTDYKRCYAPAHPGQDCEDSTSNSGRPCGYYTDNLYCNSGRCANGNLGDACYDDKDCRYAMTCVSGVCTGVAIGGNCTSDDCVLGAFCNLLSRVCVALPTAGNCSIYADCANGYGCHKLSNDADFPQCVALFSLGDGTYCESDNSCMSRRCFNNYCATESPKYCTDDDHCASDERCTCGRSELIEGMGSCTSYKCKKAEDAFNLCLEANCRSGSYFNGSCIQRNCDKEYQKYSVCSPASTLFVSFFSVSLLALLASFLARQF